MENESKFQCSGNCLKCNPAQRVYCGSQHAYSNMQVLDKLYREVKELRAEVEAMRKGAGEVYEPKMCEVNTSGENAVAEVEGERPAADATGTVAGR